MELNIGPEKLPSYTELMKSYIIKQIAHYTYKPNGMLLYDIEKISLPPIPVNKQLLSQYTLTDLSVPYPFELGFGIFINKLRRKSPSFQLTLGGNKEHLLTEKVSGRTLQDYLQSTDFKVDDFYLIILLLLLALQKAQEKIYFSHNNLYPENIILRPYSLSTITYRLGTQNFTITRKIPFIPTIINYKYSRLCHQNFPLSYKHNPVRYTPGNDICTLINSCISILHQRADNLYILWEISWMNDFFKAFYPLTHEPILGPSNNFIPPNTHPLAHISALDFINWWRVRQGAIFNKFVEVSPRAIKECKLTSIYSADIDVLCKHKFAPLQPLIIANNSPLITTTPDGKSIDYISLLFDLLEYKNDIKTCIAVSCTHKDIYKLFRNHDICKYNLQAIFDLLFSKIYAFLYIKSIEGTPPPLQNEDLGEIIPLLSDFYPYLHDSLQKIQDDIMLEN